MDWIWAGISWPVAFQAHWGHELRICHQLRARCCWKLWALLLCESTDSSLVQMISSFPHHRLSSCQFFQLWTFATRSLVRPFSLQSVLVENTTKWQTISIESDNGHATIWVLAGLARGSWRLEIVSSILQLIAGPRFREPSKVLVSGFLLWRFGVLQAFEWRYSWRSLES